MAISSCVVTATNSRQPTHYWIGFDADPTS